MKYSLANYILSIQPDDPALARMFNTVSVGGEGDALSTISISLDADLWSTDGFATGAWVHNKNLSRIGSISVTISQLSDRITKFKQMCNVYYNNDYSGFTLTLSDSEGNKVCTALDSYLTKIPEQSFTESAGTQTWNFTCGEITFN